MTAWRSIPIDGSKQPPLDDIEPSYFGHGVGRWEGDTLVIDSIGFKDKLSWVDDDAHPHSDAMHVVERWSRPDWNHLKLDLWVEDPKFYTKPWTFSRVYNHMAPGKQPMEYACNENNKDLQNGLGFGPHQPEVNGNSTGQVGLKSRSQAEACSTHNGSVLEQVAATISRYNMLAPGARVIVAVSGGPDSVCLLHVLRELKIPVVGIAHVNHKLRGEASEEDERFVAGMAREMGLGVPLRSGGL